MRYEYDPEDASQMRELADDIADAHAKGRAHYTEIPREKPQLPTVTITAEELHRLKIMERRSREQAELIQRIQGIAGDALVGSERGSFERIRAEKILALIAEYRNAR